MVTPPAISVVIPCRNEGPRILATLDDLARQESAIPFEVVVADGSQDGTRDLLRRRAEAGTDPFPLRIIDNPDRTIPAALNRAVAGARGGLIIRIDAHARLEAGYVARMAERLQSPGMDVVGPQIFAATADGTMVARIIAWCQNTRLGNGGTPARNPQAEPRRVAHTPMSCYRREVWRALGGYDEALLSNEDFDFDWRANRAGFGVWTVPSPCYRIIARSTLGTLAAQRWRYGRWKGAVVWKHPRSLHLRQILPPLALLVGLACAAIVALGAIPWWSLLAVLLIVPVALVSLARSRRLPELHPAHLSIPWSALPWHAIHAGLAYLVIHGCWAAGFWRGLLTGPVRPRLYDGGDGSMVRP